MELVIFDLDGVLLDSKEIHYDSLNQALSEVDEKYIITEQEHLSRYDGLQTTKKLELLTKEKDLSPNYYNQIWNRKQEFTFNNLRNISHNSDLYSIMKTLKDRDIKIACCSNSIRKTINLVLSKLGIIEFFDLIISNQDVKNGKPHPEMYWKCMSEMNVLPENTLIIEDSPNGLLAAHRTKANILRVNNPKELTLQKIENKLIKTEPNMISSPKWTDPNLNVLIPMAGAGSRFEKAGFTFPKPLIDINGEPMIKLVHENLNFEANFIFIVQKDHRKKYNLDTLLNLISPNCKIIETDGLTEGAACTTLLAKELINSNNPLIIANSDQIVEWDSNEFMYKMNELNCDGGILTFKSTHPKWSFAKIDSTGHVSEVAEKNPISDDATVGVYYWKNGSDYVKFAEQMISKNLRVNNEFYVCPVFNESIGSGKKIKSFEIKKMWSLGTPEDLEVYLTNHSKV
jgi:HAD superfamily hydrolase (TIGR01509 family)